MRAIVLNEKGGPEVLRVQDVPDPVPGPEDVVVEVAATALNRADVLQRLGFYPQPGPAPAHEIPGLELAGRVIAVGDRVATWSIGDEVMGIVNAGAYAERVAVHERQLVPVPSTVGLPDAAAIPEVFLTAWDALVVQGGLTSGRLALVHAGASGVGTAAIQIAKAIGARVAVTTSAPKLDACRELGADLALDRSGPWHEQVGEMGDGNPAISLGLLMMKRASLIGTVLRARTRRSARCCCYLRRSVPGHGTELRKNGESQRLAIGM